MTEVSADWVGRLWAQFKRAPNILKMISTYSTPIQGSFDAAEAILARTSLDDAGGELLDFMGELIGVRRPLAQEAEENILWMCDLDEIDLDVDGGQAIAPADLSTGGYMTGLGGLPSVADPGALVSDDEYRALIRVKAATFRKKATPDVIYSYLLEFRNRCVITEGRGSVLIVPESYNAWNYWVRDYIQDKGYQPAGIQIRIAEQSEGE
jgi:hypothetical protein